MIKNKHSWGIAFLACALSVMWLLVAPGTAAALDDDCGGVDALNMECIGGLDIFPDPGATYSKLDSRGKTDGRYLYSGCYLPDRCFRVVDLKDHDQPVELAQVDTYDPVLSPPPRWDEDDPDVTDAELAAWYSDTLNGISDNIQTPCGDWVGCVAAGTCDEVEPTCWDPGWNTHSHYVQEQGKILVANQERYRAAGTSKRASYHGLTIWDVSNPASPEFLSRFSTPVIPRLPNGIYPDAGGVHHFFFDGRYVFMGAAYAGYIDRVLVIVDVDDPLNPVEASKWWVPGQMTPEEDGIRDWVPQGSFNSPIKVVDSEGTLKKKVGLHYTFVQGDRAYLSYHQAGVITLDVSDKSDPQFISRLDYLTPAFAAGDNTLGIPSPDNEVCIDENGPGSVCGNTHAVKRIPGRPLLMVSDEYFRCPYGHVRIVDISDESNPILISNFIYDENLDCDTEWPARTPSSHLGTAKNSNLYFMAWYGLGLRAIDVSDPYNPVEAGYYTYENSVEVPGSETYDINFGPGGLLYLSDNSDGLRVLEYTGKGMSGK